MSIRTALGASRWQLLRGVLTESGLLALIGSLLGLLLAIWGVDLIKAFGGEMIPQLQTVALSWPVLGFTFGLSLLTLLLFGLAPAWHSSKPDLSEALKAVGRNSVEEQPYAAAAALVVSEIACAVVLLMCAGLLIRTVRQLQNVDPGFDYSQSLKMDLGLLRFATTPIRSASLFTAILRTRFSRSPE